MANHAFSLWRMFGIEHHHQLLLKWLILTAVMIFAFAVAAYYGLVDQVFSSDRSYISFLITLLFAITTLHCMVRTFYISRQLNLAGEAARRIADSGERFDLADDDGVRLADGGSLDRYTVITQHIRDLIIKARRKTGHLDQSLLLDSFETRLKGPHEIGFFLSDLMLRLGLLGTVVGFILMLGPLTAIETIDVSSMREVLSSMSGGMAVALYTTLCGLIGGILLRLQYQFLDTSTDELVAMTTEVTEVYVIPALEDAGPGEARHAA